jgi:hypothetical protein
MSVPHRAKCQRYWAFDAVITNYEGSTLATLAVASIIAKVLEQMVHPVTVSDTQSATWRRAAPSDGRPPARRSGSNVLTA